MRWHAPTHTRTSMHYLLRTTHDVLRSFASFMYEGEDLQQVHAASCYSARPVHHRCVDDEARSFRIGWIYNEFEEDPIWWDSTEPGEQAKIKKQRMDRICEFTKPGYYQSFGHLQGYVTAPFDWLRKMFGAQVFAAHGAMQWVLDASFVDLGDDSKRVRTYLPGCIRELTRLPRTRTP